MNPRLFFAVGLPGAPLDAIADWVNAQPDAFALLNPHRLGVQTGKAAVMAAWGAMQCRDCAQPWPADVAVLFERFIAPVTEARYRLGGYVEEWHGELLDYRLLVRNTPLADVWVCALADDGDAATQQELRDFARCADGVVVDAATLGDGSALPRLLGGE